MPWLDSGYASQTSYPWVGTNYRNQRAALIQNVPANSAITKIKVYAAGRGGSVSTRLVIWDNDASRTVLAQTPTFSMGSGSESIGGQAWHEKNIGPIVISALKNVFAGFYHSPSTGSIWGASNNANNLYEKTNTNSFPSVVNLSSASNDRGYTGFVEIFYITAPNAPSGVTVTRVSDTQQNISWTNNPTTDQPYDSLKLQRWDNVTNGWYDLTTLSSSATSYQDKTTRNDRQYQYRVRAQNAAGNSGYAGSPTIYTTPLAPANVSAARSGLNVVITWDNNSTIDDAVYIEHQVDEGGYSALATLAAGATSHTHSSPGAGVHQYRVRTKAGTLYSAYVESNKVQTLQAPSAPTELDPNGDPLDAAEEQVFTFQHNSVDGTGQTAYEIQYRIVGAVSWTSTGKILSGTSQHTFAAGTFTNGEDYEWQVRTWGEHADPSAWSSSATFTASARPVATITYPASDGDIHGDPELTVELLYSDTEGTAQTALKVNIYDASDNLLASYQASGAVTEYTPDYEFQDGVSYKIGVLVKDTDGMWSTEAIRSFDVLYTPPETPTLTVTFDETTAQATIQITNPSPGTGVPALSHNRVYRKIDGGEAVKIADNVAENGSVTDYIPGLKNTNSYYVVAVSDIGSIAQSADEDLETDIGSGKFWLNSGAAFSDGLELYMAPQRTKTAGRQTILHQFAGREYPVGYQDGDAKIGQESLAFLILYDSEAQVELVLGTNYGPLCYRNHRGERYFCQLPSGYQLNLERGQLFRLSLQLVRVDYDEEEGA